MVLFRMVLVLRRRPLRNSIHSTGWLWRMGLAEKSTQNIIIMFRRIQRTNERHVAVAEEKSADHLRMKRKIMEIVVNVSFSQILTYSSMSPPSPSRVVVVYSAVCLSGVLLHFALYDNEGPSSVAWGCGGDADDDDDGECEWKDP